jgi:primosomal protein N' (replication factor Y)
VAECPQCDVSLVVHRAGEPCRCHHCGHSERLPAACPECGSVTLARAGAGTQRIEELIADATGGLPVFRLDADSASRSGSHTEILAAFEAADAGVLVGTQMVAKGHDFPDVVLAVVVDADSTLRFPDFRAEERTFALVAQLAGRSGRGERDGRVIVQTLTPEAAAIRHAAAHDAAGFVAGELERRRELGYPPFAHVVRIDLGAEDGPRLQTAAEALRAALDDSLPEGATVLGPAPRFRLRGRERRQLLIKAADRGAAVAAIRETVHAEARAKRLREIRVSVDVDAV